MNNPKSNLKKALNKSLLFMLSLNTESSVRVPEWYDQMISEISLTVPDNKFYERATAQLKKLLKQEYGHHAAKHLLG
jgi:hypothetical protein